MIVTRNINDIEFDIDVQEANEVYFEEEDYKKTNGGDLNAILNMFYEKKQEIVPLVLTWELTNKCNFQCPFCYINVKENVNKAEEYYKLKEIKSEIDKFVKEGLFIVNLTGGECLMHPEFSSIYKYLKKKGVLVAIYTNAALVKEEHLKLFSDYKPYKIEVSIYGTTTTFSQGEKRKIATTVLNNIIRLKALGINIVAKMPYNSATASQYMEVSLWCKHNNIEFYSSDELFLRYDTTDTSMYKMQLNDVNIEEKISMEIGYKKVFDCPAGKYSFLLTYDRYVRPCFALYKSLAEEWNYSIDRDGMWVAYEYMKAHIEREKGKILRYCRGCYAKNMCQECIATQCLANNVEEYMRRRCDMLKNIYRK